MPADYESQPTSEPDRLEAATDKAIAACGGNARDAVKVLIVANEFLEALVEELRADVSCARKIQDLHGLKRWKAKEPRPFKRPLHQAPQAACEPHAFGDGLAIDRRYSDLHWPRQQSRA